VLTHGGTVLQNFLERLVVLSGGADITETQVNAELARPVRFATETGHAGADAAQPMNAEASVSQTSGEARPLSQTLHAAERQALLCALKLTGAKRSAAARMLALSRTTLYSKLDEYGLI
jgi:DNA-binding NtrC family response regulator